VAPHRDENGNTQQSARHFLPAMIQPSSLNSIVQERARLGSIDYER